MPTTRTGRPGTESILIPHFKQDTSQLALVIFVHMRSLPAIALLMVLMNTADAQSSLCLSKDPASNLIDFRPDELNRMLHLDQYRFVFFGEQHNMVFDPELKYHLITDLNKRSGTRHVFMEMSVSIAWHCNRFLQTGDTSHLYGATGGYVFSAYVRFWKRLYAYNKLLPGTSKIIIHGTDFEGTGVFPTLKELAASGQPVPLSLQPLMDTVDAHLADKPLHMWDIVDNKFILYDNSAFTSTLRYVQSQLLDHDADTRAYFRDNYTVVHDIATNSGRVEVKPASRNKTMFAVIERAVKEQHIDRFVGFFGSQHTNYNVHNSLPNATKRLKGISSTDILTIAEFGYNLKSKNTAFRRNHFQELVDLNGSCKASVHPCNMVPGFKNECDFVMIADIAE